MGVTHSVQSIKVTFLVYDDFDRVTVRQLIEGVRGGLAAPTGRLVRQYQRVCAAIFGM